MPVRDVLKMGDPLLRRVAEEVTMFGTPTLTGMIQDMLDTMAALSGAGIAAPQIGINQRIVIFGFDKNPRYPHIAPIPMTILINPVIEPLSDEMHEMWEGCLSVPGMRGMVPRYKHIRYQGRDAQGVAFERIVSDFHARVVQHECDHLDGVLYPQRIVDMTQFGFIDELTRAGIIPALSQNS
ncbi:MAG: peptide deformylase [Pseudomonadota bacterium]